MGNQEQLREELKKAWKFGLGDDLWNFLEEKEGKHTDCKNFDYCYFYEPGAEPCERCPRYMPPREGKDETPQCQR